MCGQTVEVPGKGKTVLGDLTTAEMVQLYIKPMTEKPKLDYVQATARSYCRHPWNRESIFREDIPECPRSLNMTRECKGRLMWGPCTFFVSHCWAYKFKDLVNLVIRHYDAQPGTNLGRSYMPIYYWTDVFAVGQHFYGDFKDHPDSDFAGVIRASQAVLLTILPWRSPLVVERVWCLFEALQAVSAHVNLELLVEQIESMQSISKLHQVFTRTVIEQLDIKKSKASVPSDKAFILEQVEMTVGIRMFNSILQDSLRRKVLEVLLITAVLKNDMESVQKLVRAEVFVSSNVLSFSGYTAFSTDDRGLKALALVIKHSPNVSKLLLHTTEDSRAKVEGFAALMSALKNNSSLTDLTLAKNPKDDLRTHTGGWVGPKAMESLAEMLPTNSKLRRLDLSRNIKMGSLGFSYLAKGLRQSERSGITELDVSECGADARGVSALVDVLAASSVSSAMSQHKGLSMFSPVGSGFLKQRAASERKDLSKSDTSLPLVIRDRSLDFDAKLSSGRAMAEIKARAMSGRLSTRSSMDSYSSIDMVQRSKSSSATQAHGLAAGLFDSPGSSNRTSPSGSRSSVTILMTASKPLAQPRVPITILNLSLNCVGNNEGAAALGGMLRSCRTLERLTLRGCDIGPPGIKAMCAGLSASHSLSCLDLSHNPLGDTGIELLAGALKASNSCSVLLLQACDIRQDGAAALGTLLASNSCPLQELSLACNPLTSLGAGAFMPGVRANHTLCLLDMHKCSISSKEGLGSIAQGVQGNKVLRELDIRDNQLKGSEGEHGAALLADNLVGNTTLKKLYMYNVLSTMGASPHLAKLKSACTQLDVDTRTPRTTYHS
eukprot:CAMPEP_0202382686 /NCGR_PEP_ID=MMETSP1127-20130417/44541_1 /ASSEMBLY_ACC=CAM_ASM_000462 /TAXON_ID=3047 /ORGANISM="Dunaliella tertiolecta, Strain CCMP1320" /LENGTH=832 /DNA_ID=CAMNT_0048981937 /DNA_START=143 /DNA_END=2641 /DNA_ORIENTATION=-